MPANQYVAVLPDRGAKSPTAAPVAERCYILPFVLVTELFYLWASVSTPMTS